MPPSPPLSELTRSTSLPPPFTMSIISHGHTFGPLTPKPNILIDLRNLPNPPVQLRKKYLGLSPRLRKEFFGHPATRQRLEEDVQTVSKSMERVEIARNERESEHICGGKDADRRAEEAKDLDVAGVSLLPEVESPLERSLEDHEWLDSEGLRTLTLGVQCEMGRHRSVAMAEELGRLLGGREGWNVEVLHRDLGSGTKVSRKGAGGAKSRKEKWSEKRPFMGDRSDRGDRGSRED